VTIHIKPYERLIVFLSLSPSTIAFCQDTFHFAMEDISPFNLLLHLHRYQCYPPTPKTLVYLTTSFTSFD